ncbi:MAG: GntR family transcriptional regulator [Rhizobiales bacterium]|nr:GntR family transcriptional regulator [Hyphomicrobiales bacterium]
MKNAPMDANKERPSGSLGDWLTEVLRQRIAGGGYQPGEWIREPALLREFGLSNGPVREALQNLVAAGALVREARRGVRVIELADEEVVELFQVRLALFEFASELVAHKATQADILSARAILNNVDRAVETGDIEKLMQAGGALVDWVCQTTGNRQLVETWNQLTLKARVYIYASLKACKDHENVAQIWHKLIEAIANQDQNKARHAAREMVRRTLQDLNLKFDL